MIVLGDLASARVQQPVIVPWSTRQAVAPTILRNTVASALAAQTSLTDSFTGLGGQFAHLAFPFTLGQQAPFGAQGIPAVEISLSGEQGPAADAPVDGLQQLTAIGPRRAADDLRAGQRPDARRALGLCAARRQGRARLGDLAVRAGAARSR